ncbi:DNA-3-methyladenine glycosylase I [Lacticaseibacillus saniviri]|uniref:Methyladenine glycosylase n=1 Tax=Lacticaseibacillus saniviri JCM 17471 = DSM 24301 TaxID=1293598 RepID=A0A0R2MSQ1_9LACO|nr:DNA-3-methyladenine glycosylase I [Lacticaseibacillus saniviri]KRO16597.1 methyladenine glycosylase [Lacticaseibacillus saniviri JCM 17471 = DSM 24301]MCG4282990.1 DNA-3-methyladenine glycosylase I [Lacticaseibacillus saniviri]
MEQNGVQDYSKLFGTQVHDANTAFEFLMVAVFQPGMSWKVAASKLPVFKRLFANFDYHKIATFDEPEIESIESDAEMIQNDRKIQAVFQNAKAAVNLEPEFKDLADYFWSFKPADSEAIDRTALGTTVAKDMKKRGFTFVGPTTMGLLLTGIGILPRPHRD